MRRLAWIAPALVLGLSACGSMSDEERFSLTTPGTDDLVVREVEGSAKPRPRTPLPSEVRVIRRWADALRTGHVNQAAAYFAVPATVHDGTNPQARQLPSRSAVRDFNRGIPCGARLLRTHRGQGSFVIARFRLTERRGPGARPCTGAGNVAETAFLIEKGHIVQWLRQPDPVQRPPADRDSS
jgi:hypothetical protein